MEFNDIANAFRKLEAALFNKFNEQEAKIECINEKFEKDRKFKEKILNIVREELDGNE